VLERVFHDAAFDCSSHADALERRSANIPLGAGERLSANETWLLYLTERQWTDGICMSREWPRAPPSLQKTRACRTQRTAPEQFPRFFGNRERITVSD